MDNYRFTGSQTVLYVTLEDHAVRFGESKSLVYRLQSVTIGSEAGEDGRIDGTSESLAVFDFDFSYRTRIEKFLERSKIDSPFVVDNLERAF
jgi:hypothetical protein